MSKRRTVSPKLSNEIKQLNARLSKKKSNLRQRQGLEVVGIERIDVNAPAKERRAQINKVKSFLNPNANQFLVQNRHGVTVSKRQWNEMDKLVKRANRRLEKEKNKLLDMEFKLDGTPIGKVREVVLDSAEFKPLLNPFDYVTSDKSFFNSLEKRKVTFGGDFISLRQELYKENYIKGLKEHYGDSSDIRALIQHIRDMSDSEFYIKTKTNAGLEIKDIYDPRQQDEALEGLYSSWGIKDRTYDKNRIDPTDLYKDNESVYSRRMKEGLMDSARRRAKPNYKKR